MKRYNGTEKNNVVVLPKGIELADGTKVVVRVQPEKKMARKRAFDQIKRHQIKHFIGIEEVIEKDKREREKLGEWL
jgi:hypothetical protein